MSSIAWDGGQQLGVRSWVGMPRRERSVKGAVAGAIASQGRDVPAEEWEQGSDSVRDRLFGSGHR